MRFRMKTSLISICLLAFHQGLLLGQEPDALGATGRGSIRFPGKTSTAALALDYKIGAAEADIELNEGTATVYAYGLRDLLEFLNRETGLPYQFVAGCVVNREIEARTAGHNDRIRKYIAERGLPRNSFKRWDKELFDLNGYYKARLGTETAQSLALGRSVVKSDDGKYTMRLVKGSIRPDDGSLRDVPSVVVSVEGVDRKPSMNLWGADEANVDLLWGPKDSGFAIIRFKRKYGTSFRAVDLHTGKWLREEFEDRKLPSHAFKQRGNELDELKRELETRGLDLDRGKWHRAADTT